MLAGSVTRRPPSERVAKAYVPKSLHPRSSAMMRLT